MDDNLIERKISDLTNWSDNQCQQYIKSCCLEFRLANEEYKVPQQKIYCKCDSIHQTSAHFEENRVQMRNRVNLEIKMKISPVEIELPFYDYQESNLFHASILRTGSRLGELWDNCLRDNTDFFLKASNSDALWRLEGILEYCKESISFETKRLYTL